MISQSRLHYIATQKMCYQARDARTATDIPMQTVNGKACSLVTLLAAAEWWEIDISQTRHEGNLKHT